MDDLDFAMEMLEQDLSQINEVSDAKAMKAAMKAEQKGKLEQHDSIMTKLLYRKPKNISDEELRERRRKGNLHDAGAQAASIHNYTHGY